MISVAVCSRVVDSLRDDTPGMDSRSDRDNGDRQCVDCGTALNRCSRFCSECGAKQSGAGDDPETARESERDPGGSRQGDSRWSERGTRDTGQQEPSQRGQTGRQDRRQTATQGSSTGLVAAAHLSALFLGLIGPVLVYAIASDPFLKQNAANAMNWQITPLVYSLVGVGLLVALLTVAVSLALALVILPLLLALAVLIVVLVLIATAKAVDGEAWEYPLTPELL